MATILIDDPHLEAWVVKVCEDAGEIVVGNDCEISYKEVYARLGILANLVLGKMNATWSREKNCLHFGLTEGYEKGPEE